MYIKPIKPEKSVPWLARPTFLSVFPGHLQARSFRAFASCWLSLRASRRSISRSTSFCRYWNLSTLRSGAKEWIAVGTESKEWLSLTLAWRFLEVCGQLCGLDGAIVAACQWTLGFTVPGCSWHERRWHCRARASWCLSHQARGTRHQWLQPWIGMHNQQLVKLSSDGTKQWEDWGKEENWSKTLPRCPWHCCGSSPPFSSRASAGSSRPATTSGGSEALSSDCWLCCKQSITAEWPALFRCQAQAEVDSCPFPRCHRGQRKAKSTWEHPTPFSKGGSYILWSSDAHDCSWCFMRCSCCHTLSGRRYINSSVSPLSSSSLYSTRQVCKTKSLFGPWHLINVLSPVNLQKNPQSLRVVNLVTWHQRLKTMW